MLDSAIDECENSHDAADGKKQKADDGNFDHTGVMALICRHDIPFFFANIDKPGEQQKYAVSLIEHFYSHLPTAATCAALYDVGCVMDHSMKMVGVLVINLAIKISYRVYDSITFSSK